MSIKNIQINVADVATSVAFYQEHIDAVLIGDQSADRALLDVVTATIELVKVTDPADSTWSGDDLQKGFRHVGFKVADLDARAEKLKAAGVQFHLDPLEAEGDVRITFFYDPDGTLLELVERDLQYAEVIDQELVQAEYDLGLPARPRFDHVAVTVEDFEATRDHYAQLGFRHHGVILQPHDQRGFKINYLKGGDTVLEIFTYEVPKQYRTPQLDARGYVAVALAGEPLADREVGQAAIGTIYEDADGFSYAVVQ